MSDYIIKPSIIPGEEWELKKSTLRIDKKGNNYIITGTVKDTRNFKIEIEICEVKNVKEIADLILKTLQEG